MSPPKLTSGFQEMAHTADLMLKVWAQDYLTLLEEAAKGMYHLMGITSDPDTHIIKTISLNAVDIEGLLVLFLSELIYYVENQIVFTQLDLVIDDLKLSGDLVGQMIFYQKNDIKAVTYHNLMVTYTNMHLETLIVFDA